MKILLINPPFSRLKKIKDVYFPIGLGYLAGALKREGFDVKIYNADAPAVKEDVAKYKDTFSMYINSHKLYLKAISDEEHFVWNEVSEVLRKEKPDVIGIGTTSPKFQSAIKIAAMFKEIYPKGTVIVGGPHATICPRETIDKKNVDFIVIGEGEETLVELCNAIKRNETDFSKVKGIAWKRGSEIVHNAHRKLIQNLDALPYPGKNLILHPERYPPEAFGVIFTSRGCPFNCGFCASKVIWTRKTRNRTISNVLKEIKYTTKKYCTKQIYFWDDTFTLNRKRVEEICKKMIKSDLSIIWSCETRVNLIDDELVKLMKKAGCVSMELGVESGSEKILKQMEKGITIAQVKKAISVLDKRNINYSLFLMAGLPEETKDDLNKTIKFMKETKTGFFCFSIFTPYPGTPLYERSKQLNLIPDKIEWEHFSHQSPENAFTKHLTKKELTRYIKKMTKIVDEHNGSFWRRWEYIRARFGFYLSNPGVFIRRFVEEISRK